MPGYNPATTNAWELIKRRQAEEKAATREALRVGGTQPFQTTRKTAESIVRLDDQQEELAGQQLELAEQQAALAALVESIPVTKMAEGVGTGWTPTGSWQTVATVTIARPDGKDTMIANAVGTLMVGLNSSEIMLPIVRMRVIIDGDAGAEMEARANFNIGDTSGTTAWTSGTALNVHGREGGGSVVASLQMYYGWAIPPEPGATWSWFNATAQVGLTVAFTP